MTPSLRLTIKTSHYPLFKRNRVSFVMPSMLRITKRSLQHVIRKLRWSRNLKREGLRPSTYASIIDTIQRRGYVRAQQKQMVPTFTAMAVTRFLEASFSKVVDVEFTASMEGWLDEIATGQEALKFLSPFYHNDLGEAIQQGAELDARTLCTIENDKIAPFRIRIGKYGPSRSIP